MLPITGALSAGIIAAIIKDSLWFPTAAASVAILFVIFRHYYSAALTVAFAVGFINMSSRSIPTDLMPYTHAERYYKAEIISASDNDNFQSAIVELTELGDDSLLLYPTKRLRVQITVPSFEKELSAGHDIFFKAKFEHIVNQTDLPDEIDASTFLKRKLVAVRAFIPPENIISVKPTKGLKAKALRFRSKMTDLLYRSSLDTECKEFLNATLLGDPKDLTTDTRHKFRDAGLSHVLALSGLHVGVITMIIALALWPLRIFGRKYPVIIATILILWGYALITGLSPSVTRAAIMTTVYLVGRMLQRRTSSMNSLMVAALLILVISPEELFGIGFQLSFSAVIAIILFADLLNPISRKHKLPYLISSYISLSVSAMLGTALISVYYFHSMPIYFILSNIAVALCLPILLCGGILIIIFSGLGLATDYLCVPLDSIYNIVSFTAEKVSGIPYSTIDGIYVSAWVIAIYFAALTTLHLWLRTKKHIWGLSFALLSIITFAAVIFQPTEKQVPKLYIARQKYRTDIIIDNSSPILYIITINPLEPNAIIDRAKRRYSDYMGKRNIDSIKIVTDSISAPAFAYHKNFILFGNKSLAIVNNLAPIPPKPVEYLIICRGYRGTATDLINQFSPDTVIISSDLNLKRAENYIEQCLSAGSPFINLRETPWNLTYEP